MKVRIRYVNYELNEFKPLGEKDLSSTIEIFQKFPWRDEIEKTCNIIGSVTTPLIKLVKNKKEYAEICGYFNNKILFYNFNIKYRSKIWRVISGIKYTEEEVIELIKDYYILGTDKVIEKVKSKRNTETSVIHDFLFYNIGNAKDILVNYDRNELKNHEYSFKASKLIIKLAPSLMFLLMFFGFMIYDKLNDGNINLSMNIFTFLLLIPLSLPGIIIAINHTIHSLNKKIVTTKNSNQFIFSSKTDIYIYNKSDIVEIEKHLVPEPNRSPWSTFSFWRLIMKNGTIINISNLLMNDMQVFNIFGVSNKNDEVYFPLMKG